MAVPTYTKSGAKATSPAKLDKSIFGVDLKNHQLLKDAYLAYLANGRTNNAVTKKRGQVSGGGRKPWRQKGTGNARFGSSRNPIWRGGGIAFGPTGLENYSRKLSVNSKRQALRQALSLAAKEDRIKIIDTFSVADGKTKAAASLLKKIGSEKNSVIVMASQDEKVRRALRNLLTVKLVGANYLNVYDILNAEQLIFEKAALEHLNQWLGVKK